MPGCIIRFMPLDKSGSKRSVGANIRELMATGRYKRDQAIAIALDTQRRAKGLKPAKRRK